MITLTYSVNATNYYVSTSGNDANAGTSESLPWKTLTKVNSFTPKPGDQILFKRGDEWTGSITVNASGTSSSQITYGAYGTGNKPKIYGSKEITGWTKHSGNIYKASFTTDITQLFVNDGKMKLARLTNTGYSLVSSVTSQTQFTCNTLDPGFNYSGATVLLKTENYFSIMRTVTSSSSKTLTINSAPAGTIKVNQGFVLMNKLEFLDSPGEWFYDSATDLVYVWTPGGDSPANYEVRGSTLNEGISIVSKNYITVNNLNILQQKERGLSISGGYVTIDNNLIEGQEGFGIWAESSSSVSNLIQNNTINAVNGLGIYAWISNSGIKDNTVTNIGEFDKLGLKGTWNDNGGTALEISGNGNTIEYNRLIGANYNGIFWRGNSILQYNFIKDVCLYKSDGGGIYTGGTSTAGSTVRYNIVDNSVGNMEGGITSRNMSEGIFLDEPSRNVICEYNTIVRCSNSGIMMFKNENHVVRNNTIMDARYGIFAAQYSGTVKSNITGNTIATNSATNDYEPRQLTIRYASANATFNNNTYVCPFSSDLVFRISDGSYKNIANWKTFIAGDANSTFIGTALKTGEKQEMFYNDTKQIKTFSLGNSVYRDIYGNQLSVSFTLEPFTSKILIKTASIIASDTNPPTISSFLIPSTSTSLTVPINSFTATDNIAVAGYMITESSSAPIAGNAGWSASAPVSYTFTSEGTKTLYAWTKDAAGNVSSSLNKQVIITLPAGNPGIIGNTVVSSLVSYTPNRRAVPVTFNETSIIESISIYHNGGTGNVLLGVYSDLADSPATQMGVTSSTVIKSTEGWQTVTLTNPVLVTSGQTVWLSWVFQNNPGIRYTTGTPGRAQSAELWSAGMPGNFGTSTFDDYKYSIYCSSIKPSLQVSTTSISLESDSETKGTFNIISNTNWSVSDNTEWLVLSSSSGSNNGTITVTANSANSGTSPRTATVTVTGQGVTSKTITITQNNQTSKANTQGNLEVYSMVSTLANRRAIPVTFTETGVINSISIYHNGGTGNVLLGVYSDNDNPMTQLGVTTSTAINSTSGWQTVSLSSPVFVDKGQTVWLSWVFQNNPGIRYSSGTPGRAQSSDTWSSGMPSSFGETSHDDYNYSVFCTYTPVAVTAGKNLGNTEVFDYVSIEQNKRANPVTFSEGGTISSISIYHNGGSGNVLLGVYSDLSGSPSSKLGITASTPVNSNAGWQTISLSSPVTVNSGQTVWLAWVFQNNPGIRWTNGTPGRASSSQTWSAGMPATFGTSSFADYIYSIYCTYTPNITVLKGAEILPDIAEIVDIDSTALTSTLIENNTNEKSFVESNINQFKELDFNLYPNPANTYVNIDFVFLPETVTTIEIIDGYGRTIVKKLAESTSNRIDTNQLLRGMYFVRITSSQNSQVKKLIID